MDTTSAKQMNELETVSKQVFGYDSLRAEQKEALTLILSHAQCLITLPTGAGKSLLYGLTSVMSEGVTIVVSPLTALKREQTRKFKDFGIETGFLAFEQSMEDKSEIWSDLANGKLKLLFMSPERFVSDAFIKRLQDVKIARVFVDEAHCVASWGFDFRPEFRDIGKVLVGLGVDRVVALTATASAATRSLICRIIAPKPDEVKEYLSAPLPSHVQLRSVRVKGQKERVAWLETCIESLKKGQKLIVYVQRRVDAESLSRDFKQKEVKSICYHAGLGGPARRSLEEYIASSKEPMVIFATQAFGMGIDLPEVSQVVVHGFPSSVEEFLQMAGRAGRAGQAAQSVLLWNGSDPIKRMYGLKKSLPTSSSLESCMSSVLKRDVESLIPNQPHLALSLRELEQRVLQFQSKSSSKEEWSGHLLMSVLRLSDAVRVLAEGQSVVVFTAKTSTDLQSAIQDVGTEDNQRKRVLDAFIDAAERDSGSPQSLSPTDAVSCQSIVDIYKIHRQTKLSLSQLEKVSEHFNAKEGIGCEIVHSQEGLVLIPRSKSLLKNLLSKYTNHRAEQMRGFDALEAFAKTEDCRMQPITHFFEGRVQKSCGQCDVCAKKGTKGFELS